jgi:hypothetical protein
MMLKQAPFKVKADIEDRTAYCVSRNGQPSIFAIELEYNDFRNGMVTLNFYNKRGKVLNAGAYLDAASVDQLCTEWCRQRGIKL